VKQGIGPSAIERIAKSLDHCVPRFKKREFQSRALHGLDELELKARVNHVIEVLAEFLPPDFTKAMHILRQIPGNWDRGQPGDPLAGFAAWPLIDYVGVHGLAHPEDALDTLADLTGLFTAEFAIRPILLQHWDIAQPRLLRWVSHPDKAVRRLVSEGTRPRLPWGVRLPMLVRDPSPTLPLLEALRDDSCDIVRRSVANHLNDIAKDHPDLVVSLCKRWSTHAPKERLKLIRHATRTLVKAGHPGVWDVVGINARAQVDVENFRLHQNRISMGGALTFSVEIVSREKKSTSCVVDYVVHHVRANGRRTPKVFKLRELVIEPGARAEITKAHSFRPITTRAYYPGMHRVEITINGTAMASAEFMLD